jgi:hypothetical protein
VASEPDGAARTALFPLPLLPFPQPPQSRSRRVRARFNRALATNLAANRVMSSLNHLNTSYSSSYSPTTASSTSAARTRTPTLTQSRVIAHVYQSCKRFSRRSPVPTGALVGEAISDSLSELFDQQTPTPLSYTSASNPALPIIASKVSLPDQAGTANLLDLLPTELVEVYSDPSKCLRPPQDRPPAPKPIRFASPSEYAALVRALRARGMVTFTQSPRVVNGVFGVPKDGDRIRLIIDARPANTWFREPPKIELPTPDVLARLQACSDQPLYVGKVDLDNFYHRVRLPTWMAPYFCLPPVRAGDVGLTDFPPDAVVYPSCTTLPMGWSHSVFVAQRAHEHFTTTKTSLRASDRVTTDSDVMLDRVRHSIYIDDVGFYGHDKAAVDRAQDEYIVKAAEHGLPAKPTKVTQPSADGVEVTGLVIDGSDLTIGVSPDKLRALRAETSALTRRGFATGVELSRLVGSWTWAALPARPALSVFSSVYRFIETAQNRRFTLWPTVVRELNTIADLAPLLYASLGASWHSTVLATDASEYGLGVVATELGKTDPNALVRHYNVEMPAVAADFVTSSRWRKIVGAVWKRPEHINRLEARALHTALRWCLSRPTVTGSRLLMFSDSSTVCGSVNKGRSSSPEILRILRSIASHLLVSGCSLTVRWVPSSINPADGASRGR